MLSVAFAAPLLAYTGWQPCAFMVHGPSKIGKTTVLVAAASIIGTGDETRLLKLNMSDKALQELAVMFRDLPFFLDEVFAAGGKKSKGEAIIEFAYRLSGGSEDKRHSSWQAKNGGGGTFRTIAVLTSEKSLLELTSKDKRSPTGGHVARVYDLPVGSDGPTTIFDRPPHGLEGNRLSVWQHDQMAALRTACREQQGAAFQAYIKSLIEMGPVEVRSFVEAHINAFRKKVQKPDMLDVTRHAVGSFAHVYAGGCLAIEVGLLPIDRQTLLGTVVRCFEASFAHLKQHQQQQREERRAEAKRQRRRKREAIPTLGQLVCQRRWPDKQEAKRMAKGGQRVDGFCDGYKGLLRTIYIRRDYLDKHLRDSEGECLTDVAIRELHRRKWLNVRSSQDPVKSNFSAESTCTYSKIKGNGNSDRWVKFKIFVLFPVRRPITSTKLRLPRR